MEIIIYGKDGCVNCDKTRMLCQIQSLPFKYHTVGADITVDDLQAKVGQPVRTLPQIFINDANGGSAHVGGYDELRSQLRARTQDKAMAA